MPLTNKLAIKIAKDNGLLLDRQRGSHQQFKSSNGEVTIPVKKEYPKGTGRSIIKKISQIVGKRFEDIVEEYKIKF